MLFLPRHGTSDWDARAGGDDRLTRPAVVELVVAAVAVAVAVVAVTTGS